MKKFMVTTGYIGLILLFIIFTYGFVDPNLTLSTSPLYAYVHTFLYRTIFENKILAGFGYAFFVCGFFGFYGYFLKNPAGTTENQVKFKKIILATSFLLVLSFPAFSYDIFNYILTAKMVTHYIENPYVVMPIEIPNEPALTYTRASNKVALYGPTWIM